MCPYLLTPSWPEILWWCNDGWHQHDVLTRLLEVMTGDLMDVGTWSTVAGVTFLPSDVYTASQVPGPLECWHMMSPHPHSPVVAIALILYYTDGPSSVYLSFFIVWHLKTSPMTSVLQVLEAVGFIIGQFLGNLSVVFYPSLIYQIPSSSDNIQYWDSIGAFHCSSSLNSQVGAGYKIAGDIFLHLTVKCIHYSLIPTKYISCSFIFNHSVISS